MCCGNRSRFGFGKMDCSKFGKTGFPLYASERAQSVINDIHALDSFDKQQIVFGYRSNRIRFAVAPWYVKLEFIPRLSD